MTVTAPATPGPVRTNRHEPPRPRVLRGARRAGSWVVAHRWGIVALGTALAVSGVAQAVNMYGAPQRADDEGTYVAQAWAVVHWHTLAHYTYWYDHPPLGWVLMALWFAVVGGVHHAPSAVDAGRQFMLFTQEVSALLVYVLCRRLRMARWASVLAVLFFSLSPLAISYHRMVYLDNIGMPFVLAAFVLALTPRRQLSAFAASGVCFGMAVLCKETYLLLLPALAWQVWRSADRRTRAFAVSTAATMFVLTGAMFVLYATLKGELLPGAGHVSLVGSIEWQLGGRASTGSVLAATSRGHQLLTGWLSVDPWLLASGLVALPLAWARRSTRAVAFALTIEGLTLLRPGYLPIPFVIGMLPFAAVVGANALDALWSWRPVGVLETVRERRDRAPLRQGVRALRGAAGSTGAVALRAAGPVLALACLAAGLSTAGPAWARGDRGLLTADEDAPYIEAQHWITAHVPRYDRLLVDDSLWLDLVGSGFPARQVVWFYKLGTDPAVKRQFPHGWRDFQYVVETDTVRGAVGGRQWLGDALAHGTPVASWGSGPLRVVIDRLQSHS